MGTCNRQPLRNGRLVFATDVFLRPNEYRVFVEGKVAYKFLMNLLDTGRCDLEHVQPWLRSVVAKL